MWLVSLLDFDDKAKLCKPILFIFDTIHPDQLFIFSDLMDLSISILGTFWAIFFYKGIVFVNKPDPSNELIYSVAASSLNSLD